MMRIRRKAVIIVTLVIVSIATFFVIALRPEIKRTSVVTGLARFKDTSAIICVSTAVGEYRWWNDFYHTSGFNLNYYLISLYRWSEADDTSASLIAEFRSSAPVIGDDIVVSNNGVFAVSGGENDVIHLNEIENSRRRITVSPDLQSSLVVSGEMLVALCDSTAYSINPESGALNPLSDSINPVIAVAPSNKGVCVLRKLDSRVVWQVIRDGDVLWNYEDPEHCRLAEVYLTEGSISALSWNDEGGGFVVEGKDRYLIVGDTEDAVWLPLKSETITYTPTDKTDNEVISVILHRTNYKTRERHVHQVYLHKTNQR